MPPLFDKPAVKADATTADRHLKAQAEAQGRAIDTALNLFSGDGRQKADRLSGGISGRSAAFLSGTPGGVTFGLDEGRPTVAKTAEEPKLHPRVAGLVGVGAKARELLSIIATKADELPALEPIAFDRFDLAPVLKVTPDEASALVGELLTAGLLVAKVDGATGARTGYVLGREVR